MVSVVMYQVENGEGVLCLQDDCTVIQSSSNGFAICCFQQCIMEDFLSEKRLIMEASLRWSHRGVVVEDESWKSNHGGAIVEKAFEE